MCAGHFLKSAPRCFYPLSVRKKIFSEGILSIQRLFLQKPRPGFTTLQKKESAGKTT